MEIESFKFSDYDCIGFDLDNTLVRYKIDATIEMEYKILTEMLISKGYSKKHLMKPIDYDFIFKGLVLDTNKGNILKVAEDGKIVFACHGTNPLNTEEILKYYPNFHWEITDMFAEDLLKCWDMLNIRSLVDNFAVVASLVFARLIDSIDEEKGEVLEHYNVYNDILESFWDMFTPENFEMNKGMYYPEMKNNCDKYYHKCSKSLIDWLKNLKKDNKKLFLITGSFVDFASSTASYGLGEDWRDLFDIVITFAKKPGFFTMKRDFIGIDGFKQTNPVSFEDLKLGGIYSNGNWEDLQKFLCKHCTKPNPKFLYVGDNIIQDIYAPSIHTSCDTVVICEELVDENMNITQTDKKILQSTFWGSYFTHGDVDTLWNKIIKKTAKFCVANLELVVNSSFK